jgi:hypothetical protein
VPPICCQTWHDKSLSLHGTISEGLEYKGPVSFTRRRLEKQEHLFAHRRALFYTPTENKGHYKLGRKLHFGLRVATPSTDPSSSMTGEPLEPGEIGAVI